MPPAPGGEGFAGTADFHLHGEEVRAEFDALPHLPGPGPASAEVAGHFDDTANARDDIPRLIQDEAVECVFAAVLDAHDCPSPGEQPAGDAVRPRGHREAAAVGWVSRVLREGVWGEQERVLLLVDSHEELVDTAAVGRFDEQPGPWRGQFDGHTGQREVVRDACASAP